MRKTLLLALISGLIFARCTQEPDSFELKNGPWRGVIKLQGTEVPFNFDVNLNDGKYEVILKNAGERLVLDELRKEGDSLVMVMHIFDSELRAKWEGDSLKGYFIKNYEKNYRLPFVAAAGQEFRFSNADAEPAINFSGTYASVFTNEEDTTKAVAILEQKGNNVTGTFLTPLGDYRYLEGNVVNGKLNLSVLDGNHAFLFTAEKHSTDSITGTYYSGKKWKQTWKGKLDPSATLPDAGSLTMLKDGVETFDFAFPDAAGKQIKSTDERFKNKVVIVQLLGTWCPNCMDETKFLAGWYPKNKDRGVEVVGLAFESKDDFDYASGRVKKMTDRLKVEYPVLIAGNKDKKKAAEALPGLQKVVAFPTTFYIGRDGKVKKIHTGFSGPGTGVHYERFMEDFNSTISKLLSEPATE
ncbi:MAG: peroxiredoxin family protein [Cyclobacteriaceae bacterium]